VAQQTTTDARTESILSEPNPAGREGNEETAPQGLHRPPFEVIRGGMNSRQEGHYDIGLGSDVSDIDDGSRRGTLFELFDCQFNDFADIIHVIHLISPDMTRSMIQKQQFDYLHIEHLDPKNTLHVDPPFADGSPDGEGNPMSTHGSSTYV
jgi:hypothetical protein